MQSEWDRIYPMGSQDTDTKIHGKKRGPSQAWLDGREPSGHGDLATDNSKWKKTWWNRGLMNGPASQAGYHLCVWMSV